MGCRNCDRDFHDHHRHHRHDCKFCGPDGYYPRSGYNPHRRKHRYDRDFYDYERTDRIYMIDPPRFFR